MQLYTFFMEYKGGTYVAQITETFKNAPVRWAEELEVSQVQGFETRDREELISTMQVEEPLPIRGLMNVWCVTALIGAELAIIHFVETAAAK